MTLDYSLNDIPTLWHSGDLPFPDMNIEKVNVTISAHSSRSFPPVFPIGDLLCYKRPTNETGITLLLTYLAANTPPSKTPIYRQIRIALTPEAISLIRKSSGHEYDYELNFSDVQFINSTREA